MSEKVIMIYLDGDGSLKPTPKELYPNKKKRKGNHEPRSGSCFASTDSPICGDLHFGHMHDWADYSTADVEATIRIAKLAAKMCKPQEVKFIKKKNNKLRFVKPSKPDVNYPVKGYFDEKSLTTVLVFADGTKVKAVAEDESRNKMHTGIMIGLAKRILGPHSDEDRNSLAAIYNKYTKSNAQAESAFFGIVLSYFVTKGIVKDPATFDLWLEKFMTSFMEIV